MNEFFPQRDMASDCVTLDRLKVGLDTRLSRHFLQNAKMYEMRDRVTDDMVLRLEAEVLVDKIPPDVETASTTVKVDVPATWFQHLKLSMYRFGWLWRVKRRFPVRTETVRRRVTLTVNLQRYHTFPECTFAVPDSLGRPVKFYTMTDHWSESDAV